MIIEESVYALENFVRYYLNITNNSAFYVIWTFMETALYFF